MVRKNFKMASWSLVLSIVTLLVLASTILVANTSFGKDLPFFTNTELKSDLEKSYLEIEKLISEKEFINKMLAFSYINPCGQPELKVVNLLELQPSIFIEHVEEKLVSIIIEKLYYEKYK